VKLLTTRTGYLLSLLVAALLSLGTFSSEAAERGFSQAPKINLQDESALQGRVGTLNFTGAGVGCTASGDTGTCTISGGGGGSANTVEVSLALGSNPGSGFFSTTVTGQAWVTAASVIGCSAFGTIADGGTPELQALANFTVSVSDRVAGTGFKLNAYSPNGASGTFRFHCTGA